MSFDTDQRAELLSEEEDRRLEQDERERCFEWRAVFRDEGDTSVDYDGPFATRSEALATLDTTMRAADPPFDDGWIERRLCVAWERAA